MMNIGGKRTFSRVRVSSHKLKMEKMVAENFNTFHIVSLTVNV